MQATLISISSVFTPFVTSLPTPSKRIVLACLLVALVGLAGCGGNGGSGAANATEPAATTAANDTGATNDTTNDTNITTNDTNVTTNDTNVTTNDTNITTNDTNVTTNDTNVTTNDTNVTTNDTNVTTNATNDTGTNDSEFLFTGTGDDELNVSANGTVYNDNGEVLGNVSIVDDNQQGGDGFFDVNIYDNGTVVNQQGEVVGQVEINEVCPRAVETNDDGFLFDGSVVNVSGANGDVFLDNQDDTFVDLQIIDDSQSPSDNGFENVRISRNGSVYAENGTQVGQVEPTEQCSANA